jgi:hypothetical protein
MITMLRIFLFLLISFSAVADQELEQLSNKVPFIEPKNRSAFNLKKQVKVVNASGYYIQTENNQRIMHLLPRWSYSFNNEGKLEFYKKESFSIEEDSYIYDQNKLIYHTKKKNSWEGYISKTTYKMEYNDKGQVIKIVNSSQTDRSNIDFNSCSRVTYFPFETHLESCYGKSKHIYKLDKNHEVKSIKTTFLRPQTEDKYDYELTTFEYTDGLLTKSQRESSLTADLTIQYEYNTDRRINKVYHSRKSDNPILRNKDMNLLIETEYPEFDEHGNPLKIVRMTYALKNDSKELIKEAVEVYDYEYY